MMLQSRYIIFLVSFTLLSLSYFFFHYHHGNESANLSTDSKSTYIRKSRDLQSVEDYYYSTTDESILGTINPDVAIGNPMKGLLTNPEWSQISSTDGLPTALEFFYIGLNEIMIGENQYNWSVSDALLQRAASRHKHVIWRVYCHYPGRKLALPQYIINKNITIVNGSPNYNDPTVLGALKQFITAFGTKYDGHKSLAAIQMGLLGHWGEWHTYPDVGLLSQETKTKVATWYQLAFKITKLQARDPVDVPQQEIGFHDDSFAYHTIGAPSWFFWSKIQEVESTDTWKRNIIGGETRPELQPIIFESTYTPGSNKNMQNFMECVETTHASYIIHGNAFKDGGYTGTELEKARRAHARLGYNYVVTKVGVKSTEDNSVSVDITLMQIGVAPFYYPLSLSLACAGTERQVHGVERTLSDKNEARVFRFDGVPADYDCLQKVTVGLQSPFTYVERPIKFAQGNGTVSFKVPLPSDDIEPPIFTPPTMNAPPVEAPSTAVGFGTTLTLSNANTGENIRSMTDNMVINLAIHPNISIQAWSPQNFNTEGIEFTYDGKFIHTENNAPYILPDTKWKPSLGKHTIEAVPFDMMGASGEPTTITFYVIDQNSAPSRVALFLIDAADDSVIDHLSDKMVINTSVHPYINIRALVDPTFPTNRVEFKYDGEIFRIDLSSDYTLNGDTGDNYHAWKPTVGDHTIDVTVFDVSDKVLYLSTSFTAIL